MPILDFKELSTSAASSPRGEDLEGLVRELGKRLGLNPEWSGRGSDQGRDLFFTERRKGALGTEDLRWLVSCKDFANSGRSVAEQDVGSVSDKLSQHKAQGFLLVTTTTVGTGLKAMLDGINEQGNTETLVWDRHELEGLLLQDANIDLIKRYLPLSHATVQRLSSLPQALGALELLVPGVVYAGIRSVIEHYHSEGIWLTGERIWPHDRESARTIDRMIRKLLEEDNPGGAAEALLTGEIEFDAFEAVLKTLASVKPGQTEDLCQHLIRAGESGGLSLFAYRFYVNQFEPNNEDQLTLVVGLASDDLHELYADEITIFIDQELSAEPTRYEAWNDLDVLSSYTTVEEAYVHDILIAAEIDPPRINFSATLHITVSLSYDKEGPDSSESFPGNARGYINANGMFLQDAIVDTSSYYK